MPTKITDDKHPVLVFFHGGGWITGTKESMNNARFNGAFNRLRALGYVIISPQYTLAAKNRSPFPECLIDAKDVFQWITEQKDNYNFDLERLGIMGESAGAHIALMVALQNEMKLDDHAIKLDYLIDVYGPTSLYELYEHHKELLGNFQGILEYLPAGISSNLDFVDQLFGFDPKQDSLTTRNFAKLYSPVNYVDNSMPPCLIIHGNKDRLVPITQSEFLIDVLQKNDCKFQSHTLENTDHAFIGISSNQKTEVQNWIVEFITENDRDK